MKKVSTSRGITIILVAAIILLGGAFAYGYFAVQNLNSQMQSQAQAKNIQNHK